MIERIISLALVAMVSVSQAGGTIVRQTETKKAANPNLTYDAFIVSELTEEQFNTLLEGSGLDGCGAAFAEIEEEYGVNGLFALSVANLESGLGKACANTNNFFGFMGSGGRWMKFATKEDGISYFGELISGKIYSGKTIDQIAGIYCPGSARWAGDVRWLMKYHFERLDTTGQSEAADDRRQVA